MLSLVIPLQNGGQIGIVGKAKIIEIAGTQLRHGRIAAQFLPKILDEIGRELADPDVDWIGDLLAHTAVGGAGLGLGKARIGFHHQHPALVIRVRY